MLSVCSTRPRARRGEVQLEVAGGVPGEGADPPVGGDAEVVEHAAEAAGALGPLAVGRALDAGGRGGDDLLLGEELLGPVEEVRQRERSVLHQALHGIPLSSACVATLPARGAPHGVEPFDQPGVEGAGHLGPHRQGLGVLVDEPYHLA